jgi:hypothetical protein
VEVPCNRLSAVRSEAYPRCALGRFKSLLILKMEAILFRNVGSTYLQPHEVISQEITTFLALLNRFDIECPYFTHPRDREASNLEPRTGRHCGGQTLPQQVVSTRAVLYTVTLQSIVSTLPCLVVWSSLALSKTATPICTLRSPSVSRTDSSTSFRRFVCGGQRQLDFPFQKLWITAKRT